MIRPELVVPDNQVDKRKSGCNTLDFVTRAILTRTPLIDKTCVNWKSCILGNFGM